MNSFLGILIGNNIQQTKKNYAKKDSILIDDRASNISDWNAAGGIGILHTSTATTLDKLSEYGI